jgi:hypothetical protein
MIFGFVLQFTIVNGLNSNLIFIIYMEPPLKNDLIDTSFFKTIDVHMWKSNASYASFLAISMNIPFRNLCLHLNVFED